MCPSPCSFAIVIWGVLTQKKPFAGEWTCQGWCSRLSWPREGGALRSFLCKEGLPIAEGAALACGAGGLSRQVGW